jgi:lysophospholipase L1-like esterase
VPLFASVTNVNSYTRRAGGQAGGGGATYYGEVYHNRLNTNITAGPFTLVMQVKAANLLATPSLAQTKVRVSIRGPGRNVYIGHRAAAGNLYDFAATPVPVLFSGGAILTQAVSSVTESDETDFVWNGTSDILVALEQISTTYVYRAGLTGIDAFFKGTGGEAATVDKTGYSTAAGTSYALESLRLNGFTLSAAAPDNSAKKVVLDGNSLTAGNGVASQANNYPSQLTSLRRYGQRTVNLGVPSATTAQRRAANSTAAQFEAGAIAVLWEGTNSLYFGASTATTISDYSGWCTDVRAQGFKVVAVTVLPRSDGGTPASFETDRQTVNTSIRANWSTYADALADVGADMTIGEALDSDNTTYYNGDKVHMIDAGYAIVAGIIEDAVTSLL